jgi:hypothetical protein
MPIDDDDRPRRSRRRRDDDDDYEHDRPARPPRKKKGSRLLVILLVVVGLPVVLCCGGVGAIYYFWPKQIEVLDATRAKTPQGGTASVTVTIRIGATRPGGMISGDYNFMFKAGNRTSVHSYTIRGRAGGDDKMTFLTPELANETGPVEFWVERDDRGSGTRVSEVRSIP